MTEENYKEITDFIDEFRSSKPFFSAKGSYWFSVILGDRFDCQYNVSMLYDSELEHFVTKIGDRIFDITGDVTNAFEGKHSVSRIVDMWEQNPEEYNRIMDDGFYMKHKDYAC